MTNPEMQAIRDSVRHVRLQRDMEWFSHVRRDTGGAGEDLAANYIAQQLAEAGIPATVHELDAFLSYPVQATLEVLTPEVVELPCLTHSFAQSTGPEGLILNLVQVDHACVAQGAGKAALLDGIATPVTVLRASQAGCAATIFVNPGHVIHNMIVTTIWGTPGAEQAHKIPSIPSISVNRANGKRLQELLAQGDVKIKLTTKVNTGWFTSKLPEVRIPGAQDPDTFVLAGGHYCGWDVGVTDNATGDACLLELARVLWQHRDQLERTVRICWWPGHSHGRYSGSTWYADTFFSDMANHCIAYHNIDSPGVRGATHYVARHTTAEAEAFCQGIIQDLTDQSTVQAFRPTRAADQSFLSNGVPSFSTYPLLPEGHPDRWSHTGGSGTAWWWHSDQDTLDKADIDILTQDTQISLTALISLANAIRLPFDQSSTARQIDDMVAELQQHLSSHLDLQRTRGLAGQLLALAQDFESERNRNRAEAKQTAAWNEINMRLSRILNPVIYSRGGRFHHDPADWLPSMGSPNAYTFPALRKGMDLPELVGQPGYGFLRATMIREINRLETALGDAIRLIKHA